ncbi:amidase signature domain-containing protein [Geopyxis carbonaria]|nr:amidase signature domain-containing protein [Geopyxis carbonaria]
MSRPTTALHTGAAGAASRPTTARPGTTATTAPAPALAQAINYPTPLSALETPYSNPAPSNPTVSGLPLALLSSVVASLSSVQQLLWNNAGFSALRTLEATGALDAHAPRFDPTVVPAAPAVEIPLPTCIDASLDPIDCGPPKVPQLSAKDYIAAYKSRKTTPTEVMARILDTLDAEDKHYFIYRTPRDVLLAAADLSTARYAAGTPLLLDGVPTVVKDELDVAGTVRTLGLSASEAAARIGGPATTTSWAVQCLIDAGMLLLGKANMHELGLDTLGNNAHWGTPENPQNPGFYPGGSSGGSGAAVGAGLVPIAVGADGGGSIRIPATYCGACGLKPTHGRVSIAPTQSIAPSVGVAGPIAATIADLELAYRVMSTPNPSEPGPRFPLSSPHPPGHKRVLGVYRPWFTDADPAVAQHTATALEILTDQLGYATVDITLPYLPESRTAHALTILTEIGQGFCRGSSRGLSPATKLLVAVSARTPARDFLLAQRLRALMMSHLAALWREHPGMIIVSPVAPHVGVPVHKGVPGGRVSDANTSLRSMQYVFLANWVGAPSISFPVGYCGKTEMPVGIMGVGEWGDEDGLLMWGREWERLWGSGRRRSEREGSVLEGGWGGAK